jgi:hypothetical protein
LPFLLIGKFHQRLIPGRVILHFRRARNGGVGCQDLVTDPYARLFAYLLAYNHAALDFLHGVIADFGDAVGLAGDALGGEQRSNTGLLVNLRSFPISIASSK